MSDAVSSINFRLDGKVAVITGAARGIGKAIAETYAANGAKLVLVDILEEVHRLAGNYSEAICVNTDLTQTEQLNRIVQSALDHFGRIDVLVNNAGIVRLDDAQVLAEADWDLTMAVNLKAPFMLTQLVGRQMIAQRGGKIINISSQAGIVALAKHVAYCASKAAIISMTKVLAIEWAKYGICVNNIAPTVVLTELGRQAWAGERGEEMKAKIPVRRFALPEEIAAAALFLASSASDMITGETLVIDGGYTIQ